MCTNFGARFPAVFSTHSICPACAPRCRIEWSRLAPFVRPEPILRDCEWSTRALRRELATLPVIRFFDAKEPPEGAVCIRANANKKFEVSTAAFLGRGFGLGPTGHPSCFSFRPVTLHPARPAHSWQLSHWYPTGTQKCPKRVKKVRLFLGVRGHTPVPSGGHIVARIGDNRKE